MIDSSLYVQPVRLDPTFHRAKKLGVLTQFGIASRMHAAFVTATEFPQAALDFPIMFVATGERDAMGRSLVSPIGLLGLVPGENLHVNGETWDGRYVPASIRRYPFFTAPVPGESASGVFIDVAWSGISDSVGEPLFEADDKPAPALAQMLEFLERFEFESRRTRAFCERLVELEVLKETKADITLGDGKALAVEGFFAVDDEKLQALPDATVVELHRNGILMLMQLHIASLSNMRHMVARKSQRMAAAQAQAPASAG